MGRQALILSMSLSLLPLAFIGSVSAHGGVVYPPIWQAGASIPLDEIVNDDAFTDPPVRDPNSGRAVKNVKSWLTDQAYTGGIGDQFKKEGPITNDKTNKNLRKWDRCGTNCMIIRTPGQPPAKPQLLEVVAECSEAIPMVVPGARTIGLQAPNVVRMNHSGVEGGEPPRSEPTLGSTTSPT